MQKTWLKMLASDLAAVWIMTMAGACLGFAINQLRDKPLPLVYVPKAERIQQAVARIMQTGTPQIPPKMAKQASYSAMRAVSNTIRADGKPQEEASEVREIDLLALLDIVDGKAHGVILDARPAMFHRLGHIPGALSLPREEFESSYEKQRGLLEKDKSQTLAVYCSGGSCEDGRVVADALVKLKYTQIYIFRGGWGSWTKAHLMEERMR